MMLFYQSYFSIKIGRAKEGYFTNLTTVPVKYHNCFAASNIPIPLHPLLYIRKYKVTHC